MRFVHFTDDTTVFASNSNINNVHATVNRELVGVDNWLKANRLSLNVSKTSYMIISNQKYAIHIRVRDSILTKVSTVKFMVVTLDKNRSGFGVDSRDNILSIEKGSRVAKSLKVSGSRAK